MAALLRHTLCYLDKKTHPISSHPEAHMAIFHMWLESAFPLIITRQSETLLAGQVQLAIPYFDEILRKKIRVSFIVSQSDIHQTRELPYLCELFPMSTTEPYSAIQVYGSYCWQFLTNIHYVQEDSDLDLLISYADYSLSDLLDLCRHLAAQLNIKSIDGELRFPGFGECSLGELIQDNPTERILFKTQQSIYLESRERLYASFPALNALP